MKKTKKVVEKRHPLYEGLKQIQKQIDKSELYADANEFIMALSGFVLESKPKGSLRSVMEQFVDKVEMFVTEKDRIVILVENKLSVKVRTIREAKGKWTINVVKDKKRQTMYVEKDKDGYVYGIGNYQIGKL